MLSDSEIEKELRYLTQLKVERFNSDQLAMLANSQEYGKNTPQYKAIVRKRDVTTKDPTINTEGRFHTEFPGKKESYIETYNANRWQGYIICEGPDPDPKYKNTAIQGFVENILNNSFYNEIDISTLLIVGSPHDKLENYENMEAFADYFSKEGNYGNHTLIPVKPELDKSTQGIKHFKLIIRHRGREIKEVDLYQVVCKPLNIANLTADDIKLLHEIAQIEPSKLAAHDSTGLDYAAAFILSFSFYRHFNNFIGSDERIFKKPGKMLKNLNDARPGAIQRSEQFIFAIRLSFELHQVRLDLARSKIHLSLQKQSEQSLSILRSSPPPPPPMPIFLTTRQNIPVTGQMEKDEKVSPGMQRSASAKHIRFNQVSIPIVQPTYNNYDTNDNSVHDSNSFIEARHQSHRSPGATTNTASNVINGNGQLQIPSSLAKDKTNALDIPHAHRGRASSLCDSEESTSPQSTDSLSPPPPQGTTSLNEDGKVRLVCIIGSLNTKRAENEELRRLLVKQGFATFIIDVGTYDPTDVKYPVDVKISELVAAAGYNINELRKEGQRTTTVSAVKAGLAKYIIELNKRFVFDAVIGMGGSNGTDIVTSAMQQLPESIPKVCISTVAGHKTWNYTKGSGIILLNPITDIGGGVNSYVQQVIENAVGALAGMMRSPRTKALIDQKEAPKKPTIVTSKFGVTTPAVDFVADVLQKHHGYNVLQFHMVGTGGQTMEGLIESGASVNGVVEFTLAEIAGLLDNGVWSAGPHRLTAAIKKGIPQVVSLGALDMTILDKDALKNPIHAGRTIYKCNPDVYAKRNGIHQFSSFASHIIDKLAHAKAPVIILIPAKGLSAFDKAMPQPVEMKPGDSTKQLKIEVIIDDPHITKTKQEKEKEKEKEKAKEIENAKLKGIPLPNIDAPHDRSKDIIWYDSNANRFFFKLIRSLAARYAPQVTVIQMDSHINDPEFAQMATRLMLLALAIHEHFRDNNQRVLRKACEIAIFEYGWDTKEMSDIAKEAEKTNQDIKSIIEKVQKLNLDDQLFPRQSLPVAIIDEYRRTNDSPSIPILAVSSKDILDNQQRTAMLTKSVPQVLSYTDLLPGTVFFASHETESSKSVRRNSAPSAIQHNNVLPQVDGGATAATGTAAAALPERPNTRAGVQN